MSKVGQRPKRRNLVPDIHTQQELLIEQLSPPGDDEAAMQIEEPDAMPTDQSRISDHLIYLLSKNKINSKNAFELPIIDLEQLSQFATVDDAEAWKKIANTLDCDWKIYSYRIDATHTVAYRLLNNIAQFSANPSNAAIKQPEPNSEQAVLQNVEGVQLSKLADTRHLQKNIGNLNAVTIEGGSDCLNPFWEKIRRNFDSNSLSDLHLNRLEIESDLSLQLVPKNIDPINSASLGDPHKNAKFLETIECPKYGHKSFTRLEKTRGETFQVVPDYHAFYESMLRSHSKIEFLAVPQEVEIPNNSFKIRNQTSVFQMLDEDEKAITNIKKQRMAPIDDPLFETEDLLVRNDVLTLDTVRPTRSEVCIQKYASLPTNHQVLPIEEITFLRQTKIVVVEQQIIEQQTEQDEINRIDIRRQQRTISMLKNDMRKIIKEQGSFEKVVALKEQMTTAMCFLTVLHLASEDGLMLTQTAPNDFIIEQVTKAS